MSGFNSFLGGIKAGQGAKQQRQSAFNASMLSRGQQALQAEKLDQMKANRQLVQDAGAAYETGDFAGAQVKAAQGGNRELAAAFGQMSEQQRQGVKDHNQKLGRFAASIQTLPPEQQGPAIMEFGPDFNFDPETIKKAAANPTSALTALSSSLRDIETMIGQSNPETQGLGAPLYGVQTGPSGVANAGFQSLAEPADEFAQRYDILADDVSHAALRPNPQPMFAPSQDISQVADNLDYDALPSGSQYTDPNGILRTKR